MFRRSTSPYVSDSDSENEDEGEEQTDQVEQNELDEPEEVDGKGIEMQNLPHTHSPVERDTAGSLYIRDPADVQLTLQVLGLMCDGQNRKLQVQIRLFIKWDHNMYNRESWQKVKCHL